MLNKTLKLTPKILQNYFILTWNHGLTFFPLPHFHSPCYRNFRNALYERWQLWLHSQNQNVLDLNFARNAYENNVVNVITTSSSNNILQNLTNLMFITFMDTRMMAR